MDRFEALTIFVAVAETGGVAKAVRALNVSPPAVTRAIAALEEQLGMALCHHFTRTVALTNEGMALLDRARDILLQLREAEHLVMGGSADPRGALHLTAPVLFGRMHELPVICWMLSQHRGMTARPMLLDRNIRLVEEGIDVAARIGPLSDSSLIAIPVGTVRQSIVAIKEYFTRHGTPVTPDDIRAHDIIAGDSSRVSSHWRFGPTSATSIPGTPRLTVNSLDGVIAATKAGIGLANVLSYQV